MAGRSQRDLRSLREKASSLLAKGETMEEVAVALGVSARTVRRWHREQQAGRQDPPAPSTTPRPRAEALAEMLRAEGPAVARVLLDLAKEGDVRAAALVVKLLGNTLTSAEESDEADSETALHDIERELSSLPPAIASEIVGLLAQAQSEAADETGGKGPSSGGGNRRSVRLPWQEEDRPPDEGRDPL